MQRKGDAVAAMRPVFGQTLADIQARLIFRAQAFIKVCLSVVDRLPVIHKQHTIGNGIAHVKSLRKPDVTLIVRAQC